MSQIIYFSNTNGETRHATLVHAGGHVLLRDVPESEVENLKETVREWKGTLTDVANVTVAEVEAFCESQGYTRLPDFNPPLIAFSFTPAETVAIDPHSLAAMSLAQLRGYAQELGVDVGDNLKKAEVIAKIEAKLNEGQ